MHATVRTGCIDAAAILVALLACVVQAGMAAAAHEHHWHVAGQADVRSAKQEHAGHGHRARPASVEQGSSPNRTVGAAAPLRSPHRHGADHAGKHPPHHAASHASMSGQADERHCSGTTSGSHCGNCYGKIALQVAVARKRNDDLAQHCFRAWTSIPIVTSMAIAPCCADWRLRGPPFANSASIEGPRVLRLFQRLRI